MNFTKHIFLAAAFLVFSFRVLAADRSGHGDVFDDLFFPPDLILHSGEAIHLTEEQRRTIITMMERATERFGELEATLKKERATLAAMLKEGDAELEQIKDQVDALTAAERDLRGAQLKLMSSLRQSLKPEQRAKLGEMRASFDPKAMEERMKEKVSRVEQALQARAADGKDMQEFMERMQKLSELMSVGKVQEAERFLDEMLKELEKD